MTTKIGGYQDRPVQVGTEKSVSRSRDVASSAAGSAVSGSPVKITDQARQLAALEQAVQSMPIVDEARVSEVRLALEQGRYEVSPERIADKLLRTEQELRATES